MSYAEQKAKRLPENLELSSLMWLCLVRDLALCGVFSLIKGYESELVLAPCLVSIQLLYVFNIQVV